MEVILKSTSDIRTLLRMNLVAAALDTALEKRLFWGLQKTPMSATQIANNWNVPLDRIQYLLEILVGLKLLNKSENFYSPSAIATSLIIDTFNADSWVFLARAARNMYLVGYNLIENITHPQSVWAPLELAPPSWFKKMKTDDDYAKKFTYTLFDIHKDIAKHISQELDLKDFNLLMDLGGGSGVISMALLGKFDQLTAVIIDIPKVCEIGNEISDNFPHKDRISYLARDFLREDLPKGSDIILQCDSGIYSEEFFKKIYRTLIEGGMYIIIANLDEDSAWIETPNQDLSIEYNLRLFQSSLGTDKIKRTNIDQIKSYLISAKFRNISYKITSKELLIIQAHKLES